MDSLIKNNVYGGNRVYSPDNELMFVCSDKRFLWYVNRGLMEVESLPPLGKGSLKFNPKGKGKFDNPDIFLEKENKCVVCGCEDGLTRHHVVPRRFRRHFPETMNRHIDYDILLLCDQCHKEYEVTAREFDDYLFDKFSGRKHKDQPPSSGKDMAVYSAAKAICFFSDKIPENILEDKKHIFEKGTGLKANSENLTQYIRLIEKKRRVILKNICHEEDFVKSLDDPDSFVVLWRQHFVDTMKPSYLPQGWQINGPTRRPQ